MRLDLDSTIIGALIAAGAGFAAMWSNAWLASREAAKQRKRERAESTYEAAISVRDGILRYKTDVALSAMIGSDQAARRLSERPPPDWSRLQTLVRLHFPELQSKLNACIEPWAGVRVQVLQLALQKASPPADLLRDVEDAFEALLGALAKICDEIP